MNPKELLVEFRTKVQSNPERFIEDYYRVKQKVENSSARYRGEPIDFLYQPMFFSPENIEWIRGVLDELTRILNKTIEKYKADRRFRKVFPFSKRTERLILADPGYENSFPMARFDVFYDYDRGLQFCEFNTDGSAGMNEARVLQHVISRSKAVEWLEKDYEVSYYNPMENWIDTILGIYREFTDPGQSPETIAIVDFEREGVTSEFREFQDMFNSRGYRAMICDPRNLDYDGENLLAGSNKIDLVYRRATTQKIVERYEEVEDFLNAYRDGNVCVVGGFTSQIVHNKALFAILQEETNTEFLDEEEVEFIERYFPLSRIFRVGDSSLRRKLVNEKDRFLLKPFDKFAGHGVYVGRDFNPNEWEKKVEEVQGEGYIAQEFCTVPKEKFLYVSDGKLSFKEFGYLTGLFLYNEELSGLYTRTGRKNVIASIAECFTVPNFVIERRNVLY